MSHFDSTPPSSDVCHPPPPASMTESSASEPAPQQPGRAYASTPSASSYGSSQLRVEPESPFVSEPRTDSPEETEDSAAATPLAESIGVRFPRPVQPPERQGTAKPRDYQSRQRTRDDDELAHDQKLADMGSVSLMPVQSDGILTPISCSFTSSFHIGNSLFLTLPDSHGYLGTHLGPIRPPAGGR